MKMSLLQEGEIESKANWAFWNLLPTHEELATDIFEIPALKGFQRYLVLVFTELVWAGDSLDQPGEEVMSLENLKL